MEFSWEALLDNLKKYKELILTTIIEKKGSTPRGVNASMIVLPDSSIIGTIGGGPIENEIIEESVELIKNKSNKIFEKYFSGEEVICGGRIKVVAEYFSENDLDFIESLVNKYLSGKDVYLVRDLEKFKSIIVEHDEDLERFQTEKFYIQKIKSLPELFIFGAGHIAIPLSKIAALCDFNVHILDDRKDYVTKERFPEASGLTFCDFNELPTNLNFKNNSFIVLVTREHAHDEILLKQILYKPYKYIGMIGSKKRVGSVKERLINAGFDTDKVDNIHAPIGLKINSETPAEIAVSIIAEIIKVKNENL